MKPPEGELRAALAAWLRAEFRREHGIDVSARTNAAERIGGAADEAIAAIERGEVADIRLDHLVEDGSGPKHLRRRVGPAEIDRLLEGGDGAIAREMRCPSCGGLLGIADDDVERRCSFCGRTVVPARAPDEPARRRRAPVDRTALEELSLDHAAFGDLDGDGWADLCGWKETEDGHHALVGADPIEGTVLWEAPDLEGESDCAAPLVAHDRVFVPLADRRLVALDAASGRTVWTATLSDRVAEFERSGRSLRPPDRPILADPMGPTADAAILAYTRDSVLWALDRATGAVRWKAEHDGGVKRVLCASSRAVFVPGQGGSLLVVDPLSDKPLVDRRTEKHEDADATVERGVAYFLVGDTFSHERANWTLSAHRLRDGRCYWRRRAPWSQSTGPGAAVDGRLFVTDGVRLTALPDGRVTQSEEPRHRFANLFTGPRTLVAMLVKAKGTETRALSGIDPETMSARWTIRDLDMIMACDGRHLVACVERPRQLVLCRFDVASGATLWETPLPEEAGREVTMTVIDTAFEKARVLLVAGLAVVVWGERRWMFRLDTGALIFPGGRQADRDSLARTRPAEPEPAEIDPPAVEQDAPEDIADRRASRRSTVLWSLFWLAITAITFGSCLVPLWHAYGRPDLLAEIRGWLERDPPAAPVPKPPATPRPAAGPMSIDRKAGPPRPTEPPRSRTRARATASQRSSPKPKPIVRVPSRSPK